MLIISLFNIIKKYVLLIFITLNCPLTIKKKKKKLFTDRKTNLIIQIIKTRVYVQVYQSALNNT